MIACTALKKAIENTDSTAFELKQDLRKHLINQVRTALEERGVHMIEPGTDADIGYPYSMLHSCMNEAIIEGTPLRLRAWKEVCPNHVTADMILEELLTSPIPTPPPSKEEMREQIETKIRQALKEHGLNQAQISNEITSETLVTQIDAGLAFYPEHMNNWYLIAFDACCFHAGNAKASFGEFAFESEDAWHDYLLDNIQKALEKAGRRFTFDEIKQLGGGKMENHIKLDFFSCRMVKEGSLSYSLYLGSLRKQQAANPGPSSAGPSSD